MGKGPRSFRVRLAVARSSRQPSLESLVRWGLVRWGLVRWGLTCRSAGSVIHSSAWLV
jgi:hypothetical protein